MRTSLTEQAFKTWKADPVTREFYRLMGLCQDSLKDQWAAGAFNSEDPDVTQAATFSARGEYHAYEQLLELDFEKIEEILNGSESDDEEPVRPETSGFSSTD